MKIKRSRINELYSLYNVRFGYMTEHMEYALTDEARAIKAHKKSVEMDEVIDAKVEEISRESGVVTTMLARKLMDALFPRSMSRYVKCLEVCGVEVEEDAG